MRYRVRARVRYRVRARVRARLRAKVRDRSKWCALLCFLDSLNQVCDWSIKACIMVPMTFGKMAQN